MIPLSLYKIAVILHAKCVGDDVIVDTISIHSSSIKKKCMFIALRGKHFDGHDFAEQAVFLGAQALLVNRYLLLNVPQLIVVDTQLALMQLATWVRLHLSPKVIAVTGSSGKTSVKEMTASILKSYGKVIFTQDNLNNLIGVSITVLRLTNQHNFAVIELGSSNIGEIYRLSKMVFADVALVNNIYPSHLLGFKSLIQIKKEKGEVFLGLSGNGQAVINADNHAFSIWHLNLKKKNIWRFSLYQKEPNVDFFSSNIIYYNDGIKFTLHTPYGKSPVFLSMFFGLHNVANALAASALAFSVGANLPEIVYGLQNTKAIPGRLYPISLNRGKLLLLDDTYNSNVGSMISAIHVLNAMPGHRILIISDMLELGLSKTITYHRYIGKLIMKTNIDQVFTVGNFSYIVSKICKRGQHFKNKAALIVYLYNILYLDKHISIVIKGSRKFQMEEIVNCIKDEFKCYSI